MQLKSIIAALAAMSAGLPAAYSAEDDARAAQVMWNAWLCSIYAELKGDTDEQGRLFTLGHSKGNQFIEQLQREPSHPTRAAKSFRCQSAC